MAKIGYARVSTKGQKDDTQVDDLNAYGVDRLFVDHGVSGKHASRPEFDKALAYLREGDVLVITRLSRAMRSLHHLLDLVNGTKANNYRDGLKARGVGLVVLKQGIDTTTPQGRLTFHILAALDEFQRELIVEGTNEGLRSARARGRKGGRKAKLTPAQAAQVRKLYDAKDMTVAEIGEQYNISRETVYRYVKAPKPAAKVSKPSDQPS
jgi:DNA invertase Pin-like site-specific DNA recombinase